MSTKSGLSRFLERTGLRYLPQDVRGSLSIRLPSGAEARFGTPGNGGPEAALVLKDYSVLWAAFRRGALGFAESYMTGRVDSPDLTQLFRFFIHNFPALSQAGRGLFRARLPDRVWHLARFNSRRGAKRNIEAHYDLGNGFYELWLDPSMTYSSAIFTSPDMSLEAAQAEKYARVLAATAVQPGGRILEIGCGWGGFAETAGRAGVAVDGITLSHEQLAFTEKRMADRGLANVCRAELRDYRDTQGTYDGIASIEMIEAVGEQHWPAYFKTLHDRLKPGGKAAIQAITIAEEFFDSYRRKVDFIQRYIFPGGMLLTPRIIAVQAEKAGLTLEKSDCFGESYARTLELWRHRFEAAWPAIARLGFDERFRRMWRYYLAYCEAGFRDGSIDVGIYTLAKPAA